MTAIAGFVHNDGKVWIGGDSAAFSERDLSVRADSKVFRNGEFLFGFTSSFRMGQVLRYKFKPPERHEQELYSYMVTTFVDAIRQCLKEAGFARKENEMETGGEFLVGHGGRLFTVYSDYQIAETMDGYAACGSASSVVCGALFASQGMSDPDARIRLSLNAAEHHNCYVRGPFVVDSI